MLSTNENEKFCNKLIEIPFQYEFLFSRPHTAMQNFRIINLAKLPPTQRRSLLIAIVFGEKEFDSYDIHENLDEACMHAAACGNLNFIKYVIVHGFDIQCQNCRPVRLGLHYKNDNVADYLLTLCTRSEKRLCLRNYPLRHKFSDLALGKMVRKNNLLKHVLKPTALCIQMIFF
jgi:hypothetical protein